MHLISDGTEDNDTSSIDGKTPSDIHRDPSYIHPFSLFEADKLVLPQKPLYAVYGYAVKLLASPLFDGRSVRARLPSSWTDSALPSASESRMKDGGGQSFGSHFEDNCIWSKCSAKQTSTFAAQVDRVTRTILLQNPEHVRALNIRRKLILSHFQPEQPQSQGIAPASVSPSSFTPCETAVIIKRELHLVQLILEIAANAKMGTLWSYRRWLLSILYRSTTLPSAGAYRCSRSVFHYSTHSHLALELNDLVREIDLVSDCAAKYPRNYQAWSHRSWLLKPCFLERPSPSPPSLMSFPTSNSDARQVRRKEVEEVLHHVSINITDHTAVHHLISMVRLFQQSVSGVSTNALPRDLHSELCSYLRQLQDTSLDNVRRYPHRETPWLFLRGAVWLSEQQDERGRGTTITDPSRFSDLALATAKELASDLEKVSDGARAPQRTSNAASEDRNDKVRVIWSEEEANKGLAYARRTLSFLSGSPHESGDGRAAVYPGPSLL